MPGVIVQQEETRSCHPHFTLRWASTYPPQLLSQLNDQLSHIVDL